jgi:NAD(P)-dependent dehydrogenase (short-subunit alcohol dehydrogenase family)
MINLAGRHIFVAGGSRGIGAEAARMAARAGAVVSVNYNRSADAANRVVEEIEEAEGRAFAVQADISEDGQADRAVDAAVEALGPLSGLVVSAGIFEGAYLEQMTAEFWDRSMAINVRGTFLAVRAAVRHIRANGKGGGSLVIYTSTAGQRGSAEYSAYATSKGAQIMFMRSMAMELAKDKIRVNCVAPAWTESDMVNDIIDSLGRQDIINNFPLKRIGLPSDIAGATCFLLSDLAGFITGSTITVDGGMDMRG